MTVSSVDQTELERPYTFFLFKKLTDVYDAWDMDELVVSLERACRLVVFLPNDVKEALWVEREAIKKAMAKALSITKVDLFSSALARQNEARNVAFNHLEPFVDKMVRLLDEKGWLERGALRPRFPASRKLSVETIEP